MLAQSGGRGGSGCGEGQDNHRGCPPGSSEAILPQGMAPGGSAAADPGRRQTRRLAKGAQGFLSMSSTPSLTLPTPFCTLPSTWRASPLASCSLLPVASPNFSCTSPAASLAVPLTWSLFMVLFLSIVEPSP